MDILNFISWIKGGRYTTTPPANSVTVIGAPSSNRDDKYLPITVPLSALGSTGISNVGRLIGGGIVVAEWDEYGVKKVLIASLTYLSASVPWTVPAQQLVAVGAGAQDFSTGLGNTDAIIAQAGVLDTSYAAGLAKLYLGGGFNDWYLPASWELNLCFDAAAIVNKVLGTTNGFVTGNHWSSSESSAINAYNQPFTSGTATPLTKSSSSTRTRAVRIHTL
jgi:hypothetical protein